jgi:hypothetical protein
MENDLATHLLRLGDVYLIYAEAVLGNGASTSDAVALSAFNAIHNLRAGLPAATSITFEDIWRERRLELALEGDRWYDFVRLSYYKPDDAVAKLQAQYRKPYVGLKDYYIDDKPYDAVADGGKGTPRYDTDVANLNVTPSKFYAPFPDVDVSQNPNLTAPPIDYDVDAISY